LLRLALPDSAVADDEATPRLTQAAVDAGALGGWIDVGRLVLCLPRGSDDGAVAAILDAVAGETAALGWPAIVPERSTLEDAPWATAWKARFVTLPVGQRLLIRPDWELGEPNPEGWGDRLAIWIRPGLGFGTGHHETTRLALTVLEETLVEGDTVLDYGTGSGVLALAAVRLGAGRVCAVDHDPQALVNTRENLGINGLSERIEVLLADRPTATTGSFSLIVCNVLPQYALPLMRELAERLGSANPRLIYSGYLADQRNEIIGCLSQAGLWPVEERSDGEWGCTLAEPGA
jgi:ribosomal protein L11 methyltransferase